MKVPLKCDSRPKTNSCSVGKALQKLEQITELNTAKRKAKQFRRDFDEALKDVEKSFERKDPGITKTCLGLLFDTAGELFSCEAEVRDLWCALDEFNEKEYQKYQDEVYEYRKKWIEMWAYVTADIYIDPDAAERKDYLEQNSNKGQRSVLQGLALVTRWPMGPSRELNVNDRTRREPENSGPNKSFQRFKFINDSARVLTFPRNTDNNEFTEQAISALVAAQENYLTQKLQKQQAIYKAKKLQKRKEKLEKQNETKEIEETKEKSEANEQKKEEKVIEEVVEEEQQEAEAEEETEEEVEGTEREENDDEPISESEEDDAQSGSENKRDLEPLMLYSDLEHWELEEGFKTLEINVTDTTSMAYGIVSGYIEGTEHANYVYTTVAQKMTEYCNSEMGRRPYLPKSCELCIVKPPHTQAMRAFRTCKPASTSTLKAKVCFIDYGHYEDVPISHIRRIQPEFVRGVPCAVLTFEIKDFPKDELSEEMLMKAIEYLQTSDGKLRLTVRQYKKDEPGYYTVEVPELVELLSSML